MSAIDVSRLLHQPEKAYTGLMRLQGRVLLDSDENERETIGREQLSELAAGVIGVSGSPDAGFRIEGVSIDGDRFDLTLAAGSLFVGGERHTTPGLTSLNDQSDWLQYRDADRPRLPAADGSGPRRSFVYLRSWEQAVSASEDSELLEIALNGADTSARLRRTCRVEVAATDATSCHAAFADAFARDGVPEALDPSTGRLAGTTRLNVTFTEAGTSDDLCSPAATDGYLGADNETVRVQVVAPAQGGPGRLIWSYQNAGILYRVQAEPYTDDTGTSRRRIVMLTPPWDQISQPKAGDVVEILRWGALLPNAEKTAERVGAFHRVAQSYSATDGSLILETPVPEADWAWLAGDGADAQNPRDEVDSRRYLYMRVWRGTVFEPGRSALEFTPDTPVTLGTSGLRVTLDAAGRAGDYWVFSLRPNAPTVIVPWTFESAPGAAPTGPVELLAPIGLLDWDALAPTGEAPRIIDCRKRFRPLSRQSGCCEITVGDGVHSFGDVTSVTEALARLPAGGGQICVLKGIYTEKVDLSDRSDVTICGCGPLTRFVLPAEAPGPLFTVSGCTRVTIRDLAVEALHDLGIAIVGRAAEAPPQDDITLEALTLRARDASAVTALNVRRFQLRDCTLNFAQLDGGAVTAPDGAAAEAQPSPGALPGVVLEAQGCVVSGCRFAGEGTAVRLQPHGGIHVRGGCTAVLIDRNVFSRISGAGVLLGSYAVTQRAGDEIWESSMSELGGILAAEPAQQGALYQSAFGGQAMFEYGLFDHMRLSGDGCLQVDPNPGEPEEGEDDTPRPVPVAGPPVVGIAIHDNRFVDTGLSAIQVARFFDLERYPELIAVRGLDVARNAIVRPAQLEQPTLPASLAVYSGFGGIALALVEDAAIRGNTIHGAGSNNADPYCGIFVLKANGLSVESNRITDNGRAARPGLVKTGQRGGIVVLLASAPQGESVSIGEYIFAATSVTIELTTYAGAPALRVVDNVVVQPEGRALDVLADGPLVVTSNNLTSRGAVAQSRWLSILLQSVASRGVSIGTNLNAGSLLALSYALGGSLSAILRLLLGGTAVAVATLGGNASNVSAQLGATGESAKRKLDPGAGYYRGELLLSDNQIVFDSLDDTNDVGMAAVSVVSGDDAKVCDNQFRLDTVQGSDIVFCNLLVYAAVSTIVSTNTLLETDSATQASAMTAAPTNTTVFNHATNAVVASPSTPAERATNKQIAPL